jgi:hypothetical protein
VLWRPRPALPPELPPKWSRRIPVFFVAAALALAPLWVPG